MARSFNAVIDELLLFNSAQRKMRKWPTRSWSGSARFAGALAKSAKWHKATMDRLTAPGAKPCIVAREYPESPVPVLQLGHHDAINNAVFSKDETRILTTGLDRKATTDQMEFILSTQLKLI